MFPNTTNVSLWSCLHIAHLISFSSWDLECILCRLGSIIILFISIICLIFNIRYLIWYQQERSRNSLVLSLFLVSLLAITIGVPGIVLQLFACHRYCSEIYCRLEGFVSYFGGCLCMLIYMVLSLERYLLLCQYDHPLFYRYSTIFCWLFSFIWTFPPLFDCWISYVPEGLGFHCSINWNDPSKISFYYILFSFIVIYLIPLIILFFVNFRVHQMIRNVYSTYSLYHSNENKSDPNILSSSKRRRNNFNQQLDHQSSITYSFIRKAANRKRLRIEYRFAKASICLVSAYIFAWTPYALIAFLQLFHMDLIFQQAFFITLSAMIAKLSVILAPIVYLSVMNFRLFKKFFFNNKK